MFNDCGQRPNFVTFDFSMLRTLRDWLKTTLFTNVSYRWPTQHTTSHKNYYNIQCIQATASLPYLDDCIQFAQQLETIKDFDGQQTITVYTKAEDSDVAHVK